MLSRAESLGLALSGAGETSRVLCQETRDLSMEDSLLDIAAPTGDLRRIYQCEVERMADIGWLTGKKDKSRQRCSDTCSSLAKIHI